MANKTSTIRKKPVSQKRVAVVLASLVGTMTISAGVLLLLEGGALGTTVPGAFVAETSPAAQLQPTEALRPRAWNYIIIYESGDAAASAATLAEGQLAGEVSPESVRPKANFHFVIDSGLSGDGTKDGALEVGSSWNKQESGAPYASWPDNRSHLFTPYTNAVGICVSADLNRRSLSVEQHQTLLQVVRELQALNAIPSEHILFQWDPQLGDVRSGIRRATPAQLAYEKRFRSELD
jgi:hypothetical protein